MSKYREFAVDPIEFRMFASVGPTAYFHILAFLNSPFKELTRDEYVEWINTWKTMYNHLSDDIRDLKGDNAHAELHVARRLANTFLNARQYAKDIRRSEMEKVGLPPF